MVEREIKKRWGGRREVKQTWDWGKIEEGSELGKRVSGEDEVEKVKLKEYWLDEEKDYEKYGKEEKDEMEKGRGGEGKVTKKWSEEMK